MMPFLRGPFQSKSDSSDFPLLAFVVGSSDLPLLAFVVGFCSPPPPPPPPVLLTDWLWVFYAHSVV